MSERVDLSPRLTDALAGLAATGVVHAALVGLLGLSVEVSALSSGAVGIAVVVCCVDRRMRKD